jgi:hypothetical protein
MVFKEASGVEALAGKSPPEGSSPTFFEKCRM